MIRTEKKEQSSERSSRQRLLAVVIPAVMIFLVSSCRSGLRARARSPLVRSRERARAKGSCNLGHSALFLIWRDAEKDREESERESPTLSLSYPSSSLHQSASFFRRGREPRTHLEIAFAEGEHFLSLSFSTETVTVPTRHGMRSQILYLSTKHSTNFAVILA